MKKILFSILFLGIAVRVFYLFQVMSYPTYEIPYAGLDAALYQQVGLRIFKGDWGLTDGVLFCSTPLYAYIIGIFYTVFGEHQLGIRLLNIAAGILTLFCLYRYTKHTFGSGSVALIAVLLAAFYGPFLVFDTSSLKTSLGLCLISLGLYSTLSTMISPKLWKWAGTGLLWGVATQFTPGLILFSISLGAGFLLGWFVPSTQGGEKRFVPAVCLALGIILSALPFLARNYWVSGRSSPVNSPGGIHWYIANHPGAWGGYTRVAGIRPNPAGHVTDARHVAQGETGKKMTENEVSGYFKRKTLKFIHDRPEDFVRLCLKRAGLLITPYEIPNDENYQYLVEKSPFLGLFLDFGLLFWAAVGGFFISFKSRTQGVKILYLLWGVLFFPLVVGMVTWHYRIPMTLVYFPFAAYFVKEMAGRAKNRQFPGLAMGAASFLGAAWLSVSIPLPQGMVQRDSARAHHRMIASAQESLLWKEMAAHPGRILPRGTPHPLVRIARLRARQYDLEGAADLLRTTIDKGFHSHQLYRELAGIYQRLGQKQAARQALEKGRKYRRPRQLHPVP